MARRDVAVFLIGFAVGMFFLLSWASRSPIAPWLSSYLMAQITAVAAAAGGLFLLFKK
jgi:hypothetical protein